jgi:hypothetical protein
MWAALIVLFVGIAGGGLWIATRPSHVPPPNPSGTLTATLTADPATIQPGQSVTLHWSSQNATDLDLEPGVGKVKGEGTVTVTPQISTTYTLTATGAGGTQVPEAHVSVTPPPTPQKTERPSVPIPEPTRRPQKPEVVSNVPTIPTPAPGPDPKEVKSKLTLGIFHLGRGEYDEAITFFQEGLRLDPTNAELHKKLDDAITACKKENAILNEGLKCGAN